MAAREMSQGRRSDPEGYRAEELGERVTGLHDETKWSLLTTEFWAMVLVIVAILIASAVSDTFGDRRAWLYVAIVATGYIVSRGLAKAGVGHLPIGALRRKRK
jgi:hypothetical protein